jgi:hypothetical protein
LHKVGSEVNRVLEKATAYRELVRRDIAIHERPDTRLVESTTTDDFYVLPAIYVQRLTHHADKILINSTED